jgi:hypothetical protein
MGGWAQQYHLKRGQGKSGSMPLSPRDADKHQGFKSDDEDQEDQELINQYFDGDQKG